MSKKIPVITVQCDWNDVIRLPNSKAWISSKYVNENSIHGHLKTSVNLVDNKIKIDLPDEYQYVSHSNLNLIIRHIESGLKVAFVAPTKAHKVHNKGVHSVSVAENALAVSSCEGDKLLVWDSRTSEVLLELNGHGGPVYKCRFFPSGIVVLSAGADGSCKVWSAESGINPVTLIGHKMAVMDICIIEKGRNVISVSKDGSAKLWDIGEANCLDNIIGGHGPINFCCIATTPDEDVVNNQREIGTGNKLLIIGCENGIVTCAKVSQREERFRKKLEAACNCGVILDNTVLVGCSDGKIVQIELNDGAILNVWYESASPILSLVSLSNQTFAVGRQDGTCSVMSLQESHSATRVQLTGADCDGIRDLSFNGKWLFAASRDSYIRKYDANQITVHFK